MEAKFVCNLKKYRVAQELTQEQLADIVGVRRETGNRYFKSCKSSDRRYIYF